VEPQKGLGASNEKVRRKEKNATALRIGSQRRTKTMFETGSNSLRETGDVDDKRREGGGRGKIQRMTGAGGENS